MSFSEKLVKNHSFFIRNGARENTKESPTNPTDNWFQIPGSDFKTIYLVGLSFGQIPVKVPKPEISQDQPHPENYSNVNIEKRISNPPPSHP